MGKCRIYYDLISSILGLLLGTSAFIVFSWVYGNALAGCLAGLSAIFAGVCLNLHFIYWKGVLENYHTPKTLNSLEVMGFVVMLSGLAVTVWYTFGLLYWHTPILPVKDSLLIRAVWSLIASKWGLALFLSCRRYSSILRRNFTPLHESV